MKHANAAVGGGLPGSVAAILYALSIFGIDLPNPPLEAGIAIGAALSGAALFVGRKGVRGIARVFWRGQS